jgi:hypothetical protein
MLNMPVNSTKGYLYRKSVNQNSKPWLFLGVWILHASQEHYECWSRTQFSHHFPFDWYSPFRAVPLEFWRKRDKRFKSTVQKECHVSVNLSMIFLTHVVWVSDDLRIWRCPNIWLFWIWTKVLIIRCPKKNCLIKERKYRKESYILQ